VEYRQLGRSGLRVSKLCLGTMVGFTPDNQDGATRLIHQAIDCGVNFIDTADCYGPSEEVVGATLAQDSKREQVVLATKFGWYMGDGANDYGTNRAHILRACEESLRRLQTDWIDLYILHVVDPNTPWDETLRALDGLVRDGKVRYIGTSKHAASSIVEAIFTSERCGLEQFVSEQTVYNLVDRRAENELIPACMRHGVGITPYMPLASGLLSGKYSLEGEQPKGGRLSRRRLDKDPIFTTGAIQAAGKLAKLAEAKGVTAAQLALAWLMQQPGVTAPVVGARIPEYLESAVEACNIEVTDEDCERIDAIVAPGTAVSNYFEGNVLRPLRMAYSSAARRMKGTGAYIPDHATGSGKDAGHPG